MKAAAGRGLKLIKRADGESGLPKIGGLAAVYYSDSDKEGTQYHLWDNVFERIGPDAFKNAVGRDDVRALRDHDPRLLLGRSVSGTLRLDLRTEGLGYEIETPDTSAGRDAIESLNRGDLDGSSFSFLPEPDGVVWSEEIVNVAGVDVSLYIRTITAVVLYDVGPVTFPAYTGTSSAVRSAAGRADFRNESAERGRIQDELSKVISARDAQESAARYRRLRMAELAGM